VTKLDPFSVQWPAEWLNDPIKGPVIRYLDRWLQTAHKKLGGGIDFIEDLQIDTLYLPSYGRQDFEELLQRVDSLESMLASIPRAVEPDIIFMDTGDTTITTTGTQIVICNNSAPGTVLFNNNPCDGEKVNVKRRDGAVTTDGQNYNIDGAATDSLASQYNQTTYVWTIAAGEWGALF